MTARRSWPDAYTAAYLSCLWVGFWPPAMWLLRRQRGHTEPIPEYSERTRRPPGAGRPRGGTPRSTTPPPW